MVSATWAISFSLCEMMIEVMPWRLEVEEQFKQRGAVVFVQTCGRLVQDQQFHSLGQSLGDFHQLLLADAQVA